VLGSVSFPELRLNVTGKYTFVVKSEVTNMLLSVVEVLHGNLQKMIFTATPENSVSGRPFSISVSLLDGNNNLWTAFSPTVILTLRVLNDNSLFGNLEAASLNGTATFGDIQIRHSRYHQLVATCLNLSAVSDTFEVKPDLVFTLKITETVSSVVLMKYAAAGFLESDMFRLQVTALDQYGNFIPDANITLNTHGNELLSMIGSKWSSTSANGSAFFQIMFSDEPSYSNTKISVVALLTFSCENISVISNPITVQARLNCILTLRERYIEVLFNAPFVVRNQPIIPCNQVVSSKTLSRLGYEPICSFDSSSEFRIWYGGEALIMPSDTVTFVPQFDIQSRGLNFSAFNYSIDYRVRIPMNIPAIVPVIRGSETFGSCSPLFLDGSASLNSFGRPFTYVAWNLSIEHSSVDGAYSDVSLNELKKDLFKNFENISTLTLLIETWKLQNGSAFDVPSGKYVIVFTIGRWIDNTKATANVILSSDSLSSSLLLSGPTTAPVSSEVTFQSSIFRCSTKLPVVYLWSIKPPIAATSSIKLDGSRLIIPEFALFPGLAYTILCSASIQSSTITASASFATDLRIPDVTIIGGNSKSFPVDEDIILDGSKSRDVDIPSQSLSYLWICSSSTGLCPAASTELSSAVIQYTRNSFSTSQVVTFELQVTTSRGLSSSSRMTVTFVAAKLPRISIEKMALKVDVSNVVKLQGVPVGTIPATWIIRWIDVYQYNTIREEYLIGGSRNFALIFKPNVLPMGRTMRYRLELSGPNSEVVFAEVEVVTNTPPSVGNMLISKVGDKSCTIASLYNVLVQNFNDYDTPMTYSFWYNTERDSVLLTTVSYSFASFILPCGQSIQLFVSVADNYGASSQTNVTLTEFSAPDSNISSGDMIDSFFGFLSRNPDPGDVSTAAGAVLSSIPQESSSKFGALKDTVLLTLSASITNSTSLRPSMLNAVVSVLSLIANNGTEISYSASSEILTILQNVIGTGIQSFDPKALVSLSRNSAKVLNALFDSPILSTGSQRRLLSLPGLSTADKLLSTIERTCYILGSSLSSGQGQISVLTSNLNLYANKIQLNLKQDTRTEVLLENFGYAPKNASVTINSNSSENDAIVFMVTVTQTLFALDYDVVSFPILVGVLKPVSGTTFDSQQRLSRVSLIKIKTTPDTHGTICARRPVDSSEWSARGCENKMESDFVIECSCKDFGIMIALSLPLDCEGLPYGNIDGYRTDPSICQDEVRSDLWLQGAFWGIFSVMLGVIAASIIGCLYWRNKTRKEFLKPLEMSCDNISDLLWNPAIQVGHIPESLECSSQHSLSAPHLPQPAHLQAIRIRKAMLLQSLQSNSPSQSLRDRIPPQQLMSDDNQLHLSLSDSDDDGTEDFESQLSTGFDSEFGSNTNTLFSSSAIAPSLQDSTRF
jgi:hypothetical protein